MKKALFFEKLDQEKVRCNLCSHRCVILAQKRGICGVRENEKGTLYSLVYNKVIALNVDPMEKKPLFHFLPGSKTLSIATAGCNFKCQNCQNADISQASKEGYFFDSHKIPGEDLEPDKVVEMAFENDCQTIAYTYTEPTIFFEYALDIMKLARKEGLKNIWVTNGYITSEALKMVAPYLDAVNVDLKFFSDELYKKICGARLKPVLETLELMKDLNIWLEVTTLLISSLTDKDNQLTKIAEFIRDKLGKKTPWHISAFSPTYKLKDLSPTPPEAIHKAYELGQKSGLKYVYGGNFPGNNTEDTYCPKCGEIIINRLGYYIKRLDLEGKCKECGEKIDFILA